MKLSAVFFPSKSIQTANIFLFNKSEIICENLVSASKGSLC